MVKIGKKKAPKKAIAIIKEEPKIKDLGHFRRVFEAHFKEVRLANREDKDAPWLCSGGTTTDGIMPVLYVDELAAAQAWNDMLKLPKDVPDGILEWTITPELMQFQMTMADRFGCHRVVSNRFAVRSQYRIVND